MPVDIDTHKQTVRHTDTLIAILCPPIPGRSITNVISRKRYKRRTEHQELHVLYFDSRDDITSTTVNLDKI